MKKIIAVVLMSIMMISCAIFVSASGSVNGYRYGSDYLLSVFLSEKYIYNVYDEKDEALFRWVLTAEKLTIPKKLEKYTDNIEFVDLCSSYVETAFKIKGKMYSISEYFGKYGSNWYKLRYEPKFADAEKAEKYNCRELSYNNVTVYYYYEGPSVYKPLDEKTEYDDLFYPEDYYKTKSYYLFKKDGKYYEITVSESDGFSEEDLALCDITELPLNIKPGWHEIEGYKCYRDKNGKAVTKPTVIDGVFYKFDKSGICKGKYTGWAKSAGNKVYYKDGLKVTKNTTINGVRWKFDKNGICQGKYSGFVTSSKGRRYYNSGVMLRNQKFTLNGKKYVADSKGWVTEI